MVMPAREPSAAQPLRLDVALVPSLLAANVRRGETVFVVVDVIRATTSLCMLFERGCAETLVAANVTAARSLRSQLGAELLLAGEVGGARPEGFDYGNSPAELAGAQVADRTVLFATTNGTRAIHICAGGRAILAGALRNARAVATAALAAVATDRAARGAVAMDAGVEAPCDIVIVCSGRDGLPAYDDTICAGYILRRLLEAAAAQKRPVALESGAQIALATLAGVEAPGGIRAALAQSHAYENIASIGLASDLDWCAATDVTELVPRVTGYHGAHDLIVIRASGAAP